MKQCTVPGCRSTVQSSHTRYSPLCRLHRRRQRRLGGPLQTAIRRSELKPWLAYIADRQSSHADSKAWDILARRLQALYDHSLAIQGAVHAGKAQLRIEAEAARLLVSLSGTTTPDQVIREVVAVLMHCRDRPGRYTTDLAPVFAVARAALRLDPSMVGKTWSHTQRVVRTERREVPPRVLMEVGRQLIEAMGPAAIQLYALHQDGRTVEQVEREQLAAAISAMRDQGSSLKLGGK